MNSSAIRNYRVAQKNELITEGADPELLPRISLKATGYSLPTNIFLLFYIHESLGFMNK
jgi:hypothetical protein